MYRKESIWPAKLAEGKSSAVALLRTATSMLSPKEAYEEEISEIISSERGIFSIIFLIWSLQELIELKSSISRVSRISLIWVLNSDSITNFLYARVVIANPSGTGSPVFNNSPRLAL